jgi:hypothetical protein
MKAISQTIHAIKKLPSSYEEYTNKAGRPAYELATASGEYA